MNIVSDVDTEAVNYDVEDVVKDLKYVKENRA